MQKIEFCPNPDCPYHRLGDKRSNWYKRVGSHSTTTFGKVTRYKCKHCGRTFSDQTFSVDYYAKKQVDYWKILKSLSSGANCRALMRNFNLSMGTVRNLIARMARQILAFCYDDLERTELAEDLTADGLESFTLSQYFPNNINILMGKQSQRVYFANCVTIRRKGRMSERQKQLREQLEKSFKADKRGVFKCFTEILTVISQLFHSSPQKQVTLITDKHKAYQRAVKKTAEIQKLVKNGQFVHKQIDSTLPRNGQNPLFASNYIDRQIRKDMANHVRETACFARNVNLAMERLYNYFFYHNYCKDYRVGEAAWRGISHMEVSGIGTQAIEQTKQVIFQQRRFLSHLNLKGFFLQLWQRTMVTPLKKDRDYVPQFALQ